MDKKRLIFGAKLAISIGIVAYLYSKVIAQNGATELLHKLSTIAWQWVAIGFAVQVIAMLCSVGRWHLLLVGQGIHAPFRYLLGSFMIGRFFGEFAPGGWTGLAGYRIYDLNKHTGKLARATASIGIEMVLGWIAFGAIVLGGSVFGARFLGVRGVVLIDAFFLGLIVTAIVLVSRPALFRMIAARLPQQISGKLRTTVDAACAYEGKGGLAAKATALAIGTHFFRALIYVCAARALHAELGAGEVFFGSSLQIFATLLPASVNGIGLREATAVALYTRVGVPQTIAVLIPTLGFLIEMALSSFGGLVFMARRVGYTVSIRVDNPEHERAVEAELPPVSDTELPRLGRALALGLGGGVLAGLLLGLGEAYVILRSSAAAPDYSVLAYAAVSYPILLGSIGIASAFGLALMGRVMRRKAFAEPLAYAHFAAALTALPALAIGAFRVRRDYFHEELVWKSLKGLEVLAGCAAVTFVVYVVIALALRLLTQRKPLSFLLRAWGTLALWLIVAAGLQATAHATKPSDALPDTSARKAAPPSAGNVLFIVVDTLRADHLPDWGYAKGKTPNLERFAQDAIRFETAFSNASWTRPSFASILSGRYASSHRTMAKSDSLPDEIVTMPEALRDAGYSTLGVVTNFNVAPFFNFHQGFDRYDFLEPDFVLGANDSAAKLLFIQFARQRIENMRAKRGHVAVGSAYRDASVVNEHVLSLLDRKPRAPWFFFVGYMDPHDPYYPHPYDGTGVSRAANAEPDPADADKLRALYDGEITFWDESFGHLVEALKKRGVYDELTIVLTADHGEEFMEHGGFWHGTTLYDEQVHVPLYVKLPGNAQHGSVVRHWVQSIDLMPTLLERAGVAVPKGAQGHDVFTGHDHVFAEENHEGNVLRALRTLRAGTQVKLITANEGNPRGLLPVELYRVDQDPRERMNLAAEDAPLVQTLQAALNEQEKNASLGRAAQHSVDLNADANASERLRALGYAGGDTVKK